MSEPINEPHQVTLIYTQLKVAWLSDSREDHTLENYKGQRRSQKQAIEGSER